MPEPLLYLKAMGAAAIASAMFVLAMGRVRPSASTTWLNSACVLGIGLGLALGCAVLSLRLAWPPMNGLDRFFTIVVPAVLSIELIAGFQRVPPWAAWLLRMSLAAVVPRILLHGSVYLSGSGNDWTQWQAGAALTVCSALLAASWGLLSWLSQRSPGVSIPFALHLSTLCAGLCVMMGGYIKGGAAAVPLAATLAATAIGARLITKRTGASANFGALAILGIGVVGLFGLLFIGRFFGRISTGSALTMLLAPLLCWTTETPLLRHRKPWLVGSLRLALVAIPLVVVLALAKSNFDRKMAPLLGKAPVYPLFVVITKVDLSWRCRLPRLHCVARAPQRASKILRQSSTTAQPLIATNQKRVILRDDQEPWLSHELMRQFWCAFPAEKFVDAAPSEVKDDGQRESCATKGRVDERERPLPRGYQEISSRCQFPRLRATVGRLEFRLFGPRNSRSRALEDPEIYVIGLVKIPAKGAPYQMWVCPLWCVMKHSAAKPVSSSSAFAISSHLNRPLATTVCLLRSTSSRNT